MSPKPEEPTLLSQCKVCLTTYWTNGWCPKCHPPTPPKEPAMDLPKYPEYKPKTRDKR